MKKITVWYRVIKDEKGNTDKEVHNHIEDGWNDRDKPAAVNDKYTNQLAWSKECWVKKNKYLTGENIVVDTKQ